MTAIRCMANTEIGRIAEIDRSQHVTKAYTCEDGVLSLEDVDWRVPPWSKDGQGEHSVHRMREHIRPILAKGGVMFGAFEVDKLVGFAVYRPKLRKDMAGLAMLHVSNGHRRQGIGSALTGKVIRLARKDGVRKLYVSGTPSAPTVDFYRSIGCKPTQDPIPELVEKEPEDIHMIMPL
ncbi:GNAT family N-acetyltransferase [Candidatus Hydrogenedentota bacterium]